MSIRAMLGGRYCTEEGRCRNVYYTVYCKLSHVNTEVIPVVICIVSTTRQI